MSKSSKSKSLEIIESHLDASKSTAIALPDVSTRLFINQHLTVRCEFYFANDLTQAGELHMVFRRVICDVIRNHNQKEKDNE